VSWGEGLESFVSRGGRSVISPSRFDSDEKRRRKGSSGVSTRGYR